MDASDFWATISRSTVNRGVCMGLQLFRSKKFDFSFLSVLMVPECSKSAYGQLRSISFRKWKKFYFSANFENFMVMDANFIITWKPIFACWASSHRGKMTDQKIEIVTFFFFKQKTAYEICACLVGSEMCIRDRLRSISFRKWKKFDFSAIFANFMVMDANSSFDECAIPPLIAHAR